MINIIYLSTAFIVDMILGLFFGNSFVGVGRSATPNLLLIVLILITYKKDVKYSMFLGFMTGLLLDFFSVDTIYVYAIVYMLTSLVVSAWSTRINDTFIELFLVVLSAIFLKELLLYFINVGFFDYNITLGAWGASHLVFTLILAIVPMIISVSFKLRYIENDGRINKRKHSKDTIDFRF